MKLFVICSALWSFACFAAESEKPAKSESRELNLPDPIPNQRVPDGKWKFESTTSQCDAGNGKTATKQGHCLHNNGLNMQTDNSAFKAGRTYDPSAPSSTESYNYEFKSGK